MHFIFWMSAIFLLPVCLTYWPRKYTTRVDPHVDNSHQVWSWYLDTVPSYSDFVCWYVTWPCDLDLWPLDLEQLLCIAGHVTNLATELEDPMPMRSWFMKYNIFHWLPLKMRTRPLRMRRIMWQQHNYSIIFHSSLHENKLRYFLRDDHILFQSIQLS